MYNSVMDIFLEGGCNNMSAENKMYNAAMVVYRNQIRGRCVVSRFFE